MMFTKKRLLCLILTLCLLTPMLAMAAPALEEEIVAPVLDEEIPAPAPEVELEAQPLEAAPEEEFEALPDENAVLTYAAVSDLAPLSLSAADILKQFNDDSIMFGENCTEAAFTRREYAPGAKMDGGPEGQYDDWGMMGLTDSNELLTKAFNELKGVVESYPDNFFRDGYTFTNSAKKEINIYIVAVDFPDVIGDLQITYGLHRNVAMWNGMRVDLSRVETHVASVFGGSDGGGARSTRAGALPAGSEIGHGSYGRIRGWKDPDFEGKLDPWSSTATAWKGAAQRLEEMSMGRMKINIICLNEVYAQLNDEMDAKTDWWPWFRLPGSMISYAVQGPADCEDYNQFARLHGAGLEKAREMIAALGTPEAEKALKDMGSNGAYPIDLIYTIVPYNLFGHRAGLQGGGGLDTSFSFNDQAVAAREGEYRHENGVRIEGRNIGSGVFGVKNIWSSLNPSSSPSIFLHETYHGMGQFDDYSFGWMTGPNTGEGATFTSGWTRDTGDRYAWRKFRNGWIRDSEVDIVLPGQSKTVFMPALGSYDETGGPYNQDRLIVIPKEWRARDTYGDPVGWRNDWNGYRDGYNWYDWFTNPWVGGASNSIKSFPTFYTLESRRAIGGDNVFATNLEGVIIGYLANPTTETGHGAGGWKIVSGTAGLNATRAGATTSWSDPHIGMTVTVLESNEFGDLVQIDYTGTPTNAAKHVYQAELSISDSYALVNGEFTVDFDILTLGAPAPNDSLTPNTAAIARVASPLGVPGGLSGFEMEVTFDPARFDFVDAVPGKFNYAVDVSGVALGKLVVKATGTEMINKDTILSLKFKAKEAGEFKNVINATITDVTLLNWEGLELKKGDAGFDDVGTLDAPLPTFPAAAWVPGNLAVRGTLSALYNTTASNDYTPGIQGWGQRALNTEYKGGSATSRLEIKGADVTVTTAALYTVSGNVHSDTPGPLPDSTSIGSDGIWTPLGPSSNGKYGIWETGTWIGVESIVELLDSSDAVVFSGRSDWDGNYSIVGVPAGTYTLRVTKPKYNVVTIPSFVVNGNVTSNVKLIREKFEVSGVIYADLATSDGTNKVPVGAGVDVYVLSIGNAYRILGKGITDADGKYSLLASSDNYQRPYCAVAVDVNTLPATFKGEGKITHQMTLKGTGTNGVKRGDALQLNLGRLYGMDPGDRVWPSNTATYGAGGSYNFRIDDESTFTIANRRTDRDVILTSLQELHIRTTDKNTATAYQLRVYAPGTADHGAAVGGQVTSLGNANGDDIIFNVPPGMYYVEVTRPGYVTVNTFPVSVDTTRVFMRNAPSSNTIQINTAIAGNANLVTGNIYNAITGMPIPDVEVVFVGYGATAGMGTPALAGGTKNTSLPVGRFEYDAIAGEKDIVFTHPDYVTVTVHVTSGGFADRRVEMIPIYTVKFVNWDGTLLIERRVPHGEAAEAPSVDPVRENWHFVGWDKDFSVVTGDMTITAQYVPMIVSLTPTASVVKLNGNQNDLTVSVTEKWSDGYVKTHTVTLKISNNAAGTYTVGPYKVYVDTKGNVQIRECYVVNPPALPYLGIR
ncbi:MAG: hypothetical protein FWH55_03140 [Oscillospiraceae bacterium]|nr:hypothetical protein [Oscillospiraceae bacterium]